MNKPDEESDTVTGPAAREGLALPEGTRRTRLAARLGLATGLLALGFLAGAYGPRLLAPAYINSGNADLASGNYDQAIADFDRALQFRPDYAEAYYGRGTAWERQGKSDQAIADFTQAIRLKPDYAVAYYNRGLAYVTRGEDAAASADFRRVLTLSSDPVLRQAAEQHLGEIAPA